MVITFWGIELDTQQLQLRLPAEKLQRLLQVIRVWQCRKSCTKRELLSLIGQLQHTCRVVRSRCTFLRRMISLSTKAKELHHHLRLNKCFRSDLPWWATTWNGVSMMSSVCCDTPCAVITSNASNWGYGAFNSTGDTWDTKLLWAVCCLAFFGFLRVGDFTAPSARHFDSTVHLCFQDLAIDNPRSPTMLQVTLKQSRQTRSAAANWEDGG